MTLQNIGHLGCFAPILSSAVSQMLMKVGHVLVFKVGFYLELFMLFRRFVLECLVWGGNSLSILCLL